MEIHMGFLGEEFVFLMCVLAHVYNLRTQETEVEVSGAHSHLQLHSNFKASWVYMGLTRLCLTKSNGERVGGGRVRK